MLQGLIGMIFKFIVSVLFDSAPKTGRSQKEQDNLAKILPDAFLLDIRTEEEYQLSHIHGSVNIPRGDLFARFTPKYWSKYNNQPELSQYKQIIENNITKLPADKKKNIIVYSRQERLAQHITLETLHVGDNRMTQIIVDILKQQGYIRVYHAGAYEQFLETYKSAMPLKMNTEK